jgi:hypothetical protein
MTATKDSLLWENMETMSLSTTLSPSSSSIKFRSTVLSNPSSSPTTIEIYWLLPKTAKLNSTAWSNTKVFSWEKLQTFTEEVSMVLTFQTILGIFWPEDKIAWSKFGTTKLRRQFHTTSRVSLATLIQSIVSCSTQETTNKSSVLESVTEFMSGSSTVMLIKTSNKHILRAKTSLKAWALWTRSSQ